MLTILLHTSKTMRSVKEVPVIPLQQPILLDSAKVLASYLRTLDTPQIAKIMQISPALAEKTRKTIEDWSIDAKNVLPALDIFLGDIYSGLQVQTFSAQDRSYANKHLFILSGLYGVLRALDTILPYRLEMGYKLPGNTHDKGQLDVTSLYDFWGDTIARQLPADQPIINLSAKEYTKAVFPYVKHIDGLSNVPIISPKFLTRSPKTGEPVFVTVHAKIARGAFARWLIRNRIEDTKDIIQFKELGYSYVKTLSTVDEPVFVADQFKGLGLSVRLT